MIYKNVASQKIGVFAYDSTTGAAKTGDAGNITAYISLDFAAPAQTNDVNPTELDAVNAPGWYVFDLTQAESNAEVLVLAPKSVTADILIDQVQVVTQDASISSRATQASVDVVDGIVNNILDDTGTDIPASITALNDLSAAEVNAEVVDALATDVIADSIPADGSRPTIAQALYMLVQYMNERSVSTTTVTVKKPDGASTLYTLTLDDASDPTSVTRTT